MPKLRPKRALLSVSDKTHLLELAGALIKHGVELVSTGGTAALLKQHHVPVLDISEVTQFPEIMDGRVKTLHPHIHGGILARRDKDQTVLAAHHITPIDLVVANLYPFEETIAKPNTTLNEAIEQIDIGGPTLLRAAAKNFQWVTVTCDPQDYATLIAELQQTEGISLETRFQFARKTFAHVAAYDAAIANYFGSIELTGEKQPFPTTYTQQWQKQQDLRYGENPHQKAALYVDSKYQGASIATAKQWQGKELSFNNIVDAEAALSCVKSFTQPACVIVKHANPCGIAVHADLATAYQQAFAGDPTSAFGGIIALNQPLEEKLAQTILKNQFVEVIVAPEVTAAALKILQQKPAIRMLTVGKWSAEPPALDYKRITGGILLQDQDNAPLTAADLKVVTSRQPTPQELNDLLFAWSVVKFVKSNAIVFAKNETTVGIGAGQMSRIDSVAIAQQKAKQVGYTTAECVMASDAFFPFTDSVEQAAAAGITAIIQPGGSIRDAEVIAAADAAGIAMIFTGMRHFRH